MRFLLALLSICGTLSLPAQDFYALYTIQQIDLTFAQSNWDQLLDAQKQGDEDYILAEQIVINGEVFDSVGVKYKGNSTYQANQTKNPLHIELDTYKEQDYQGYTDIKLSNGAKDPSFLREVLSYQILRPYADAPLANYAQVSVNGTALGLYGNIESISKRFVNDRFGSKRNTFVKCNPPDGAGPQATAFPSLEYLGEDSSAYYAAYELKSDDGWAELIDLCDTLENHTAAVNQILDVDRALWMLAFDNALVNLDSYIGAFQQNYYLYRDDYGRFLPLVWDLNESFGRFSMAGSGPPLNGLTAKQRLDPLLHADEADFPLVSRLLADDTHRRMYVAHFKTILLENFADGSYRTAAQALQDVIAPAAQADQNLLFSYAQFLANLDSSTSGGGGGGPGGGGSTVGITELMDGRSDYLLGTAAFTAAAPALELPVVADDDPQVGSTVTVTAAADGATNVLLGYRAYPGAPFVRVPMLDDGAHGDGSAGDGVYGAALPVLSTLTHYYVYAENEDAGIFSPRRAEYEYHTLTGRLGNGQAGDVVINELLASNDAVQADEAGEFDDWVELYNNTDVAVSLDGYFLTDKPDDLEKWAFPDGTLIDAGGYLIVWADEDGDQGPLHANFKLSAGGETLLLVSPDGSIADEITFGEQETDVSFGRFPNGTGDFTTLEPTFNGMNSPTSTAGIVLPGPDVRLLPNPATASLQITTDRTDGDPLPVTVRSTDGRLVYRGTLRGELRLDVTAWARGTYLVTVGRTSRTLSVQ